ncbi:MAG: hypothetical protein DSY37_00860 [Hyperthermus sp.]|nr:MAG: hypothetical protein DSY37_00860 [Hyperthermus sp.]
MSRAPKTIQNTAGGWVQDPKMRGGEHSITAGPRNSTTIITISSLVSTSPIWLGVLVRDYCMEDVPGLAGIRPVRLPLRTRDAKAVAERFRRGLLRRGSSMFLLFCFTNGIKRFWIICVSPSIKLERRMVKVKDKLSGLEMLLPIPTVRVGTCAIAPRWRGTRLILQAEDLKHCSNCIFTHSVDELISLLDR